MQTTTQPTGENDLEALTATVIKSLWYLFEPMQGVYDHDYLMAYSAPAAAKAVATFDPAKVKNPKNAMAKRVCKFVECRLRDLHRGEDRQDKRERRHGEMSHYLRQGRDFEDVDDSLPLSEWAGNIYRQAVLTLGKRHKGRAANGGRRGLAPAQEAALLAIQRRMHLSCRGVILFLSEKPDVVRSIRLKHLPHYSKISRLCCKLAGGTANKRARRMKSRMAHKVPKTPYIGEAMAACICGLSPDTLRGWRLKEKSPFVVYRPGGVVRYLRSEVEAWMAAQATPPAGVGK